MELDETRIRITANRYYAMVREGVFGEDDHVELLEGVIVASSPGAPPHAQGIRRVEWALRRALGPDVLVTSQLPFHAGTWSVPEPDVAVLPGSIDDYDELHPSSAHLVVEVSSSSLPQDRLMKSRIYAGAGIANYWIVNLRSSVVEWFANPDMLARVYRSNGVAERGEIVHIDAYPDARIAVEDLFPSRPR